MRILQIIHRYPREKGAGSENYTRQICTNLAKKHTVAVIDRGETSFHGPYGQLFSRPGYPHEVYSFFRHPGDKGTPEREYWNPGLDDALTRFIGAWKPDVIHFQHTLELSISLIQTAARSGCPVFFTLHDYWTLCPGILMLDYRGQICRADLTPKKCYRCMIQKFKAPRILLAGQSLYRTRREKIRENLNACDAILCPSLTLKQMIETAGIPSEKCLHWPFGIDLDLPGQRKASTAPPGSPIRFGYTGTLSPQKGVEVLLKAFSALPPDLLHGAELYIYGDDCIDTATRRRVKTWRNRYPHPSIHFAGPYTAAGLDRIQRALDVVVVPSVWLENRPLTILEAFSAGNPVLGSGIGGIEELVKDGGGRVFPPGDSNALNRLIAEIIRSPETIKTMRKTIRPVPGIDDETQNLEALYVRFLNRR